jgi:cell division protein FtsL
VAIIQRPAIPFRRPFPRLHGRATLLVIAGLLALGMALAQVNQFSRLTSTGYEIEELSRQRAAQQAANHELEAEVAQLSSLARVDIEARTRLQMVPAARRLYIEVNAPTPARQTLPTRYLPTAPAPEPVAKDDAPLWRRALDLLPF